jgi:proteasome lid subunit RPN8/RPN11
VTRVLQVSAAAAEILQQSAVRARPRESCAALLGSLDTDTAAVAEVLRLTNSDSRPFRFEIGEAEIRRARARAAERGCEIVAIAHSHAARAVPSDRDRAAIAYSRYPWVIVGFDEDGNPEMTAFEAVSCARIQVVIARPAARAAPAPR